VTQVGDRDDRRIAGHDRHRGSRLTAASEQLTRLAHPLGRDRRCADAVRETTWFASLATVIPFLGRSTWPLGMNRTLHLITFFQAMKATSRSPRFSGILGGKRFACRGSNEGQMILGRQRDSWRPHKYWGMCGAEGIRTPDPLDAKGHFTSVRVVSSSLVPPCFPYTARVQSFRVTSWHLVMAGVEASGRGQMRVNVQGLTAHDRRSGAP